MSNYRKKNAELRKERYALQLDIPFSMAHLTIYNFLLFAAYVHRPACHLAIFQAWETFLQEAETDSQACNDVASVLSRQVRQFSAHLCACACVCVCLALTVKWISCVDLVKHYTRTELTAAAKIDCALIE